MLNGKKLTYAVLTLAVCSIVSRTAFCNDEVPVRVEHTMYDVKITHLPPAIVLATCEGKLVKKCERLRESSFGCRDGFSFDPYFDHTTYFWYLTPVGTDTAPTEEIVYGDDRWDIPEPTYDLTCEGDCIAGCDQPPPEPEELFCLAMNLEYCNNVCPRLFQDENGNNAGRCFEIPGGNQDGSSCWGCQNGNDPSEVWSPEDLPAFGGGRPEKFPFNRVETPYGGGGGGGNGGGQCQMVCIEYQHGFNGYLDCTYICD